MKCGSEPVLNGEKTLISCGQGRGEEEEERKLSWRETHLLMMKMRMVVGMLTEKAGQQEESGDGLGEEKTREPL